MTRSGPDAFRKLGIVEEFPADRKQIKFKLELAGKTRSNGNRPWLIDGLVPRCGLAALYGPPGCGKSFLAIDMALRIATDREWFGRNVCEGGVVYIAAEAGAGVHRRISAWLRHHEAPQPVPLGVIARAPNLGTVKRTSSGQDTSDTDELISQIDQQAVQLSQPIRLIVIDTLARTLFGADENSSADMGAFVENADRIAQHFGCLVLVVHHTGKQTKSGMRGSNAVEAACDSILRLETRGSVKTVILEKNKEGEAGLAMGFRLLPVEHITSDAHDTSMASCVVEQVAASGEVRLRRKGIDERILEVIRNAIERDGHLVERFARKGVTRATIQKLAVTENISKAANPKGQNTIVNRALRSLELDGAIQVADEWITLAE